MLNQVWIELQTFKSFNYKSFKSFRNLWNPLALLPEVTQANEVRQKQNYCWRLIIVTEMKGRFSVSRKYISGLVNMYVVS